MIIGGGRERQTDKPKNYREQTHGQQGGAAETGDGD